MPALDATAAEGVCLGWCPRVKRPGQPLRFEHVISTFSRYAMKMIVGVKFQGISTLFWNGIHELARPLRQILITYFTKFDVLASGPEIHVDNGRDNLVINGLVSRRAFTVMRLHFKSTMPFTLQMKS